IVAATSATTATATITPPVRRTGPALALPIPGRKRQGRGQPPVAPPLAPTSAPHPCLRRGRGRGLRGDGCGCGGTLPRVEAGGGWRRDERRRRDEPCTGSRCAQRHPDRDRYPG